ncbi:MAG: DUF4012 domain-containing protein [Actinomycetota bacterium]|nr:DUF4012 domain-containing protein [Actinomycetota bacterium]
MQSRGASRLLPVLLGLVLLFVGAWFAFNIVATARQAHQLQSQVDAAQKSISTLDTKQAATDLTALAATAAELRAATEKPVWQVAEILPFLGSSARATTAAAIAADELATAAVPLMAAIGGQESTVGKIMAALDSPDLIEQLRVAADRANTQLASVSSGGFTDPLGKAIGLSDSIASAKQSLPNLVTALNTAVQAGGPLRNMLGASRPTTWLVMAQNPAELRGSGGLFSAYLIVRFTNGNMEIIEAGSRKNLDKEFPRAQQIPYWKAVSPETAGTWGPALGEWASFNIAADFPTVARLASAGMTKRGTPIDGVIAIDPSVTAAILAGTGPVEHKGVTIDSSTAERFFTQDLYEEFPGFSDVAAKDELAMGLTYATIDAALKRPLDGSALWGAMSKAVEAGHLKVWSKNRIDQAWLETLPIAAAFAQHPQDLIIGFVNGTGGKLDPYVTRQIDIDSSNCPTDGTVSTTIRMHNQVPKNLPPYVDVTLDQDGIPDPSVPSGFTRTFVTAYAPGTTLEDSSYLKEANKDGKAIEPAYGGTSGRPNWMVPVELKRGESTELRMVFKVTKCPEAAG